MTPVRDERGWFVRTFDAQAFAAHGLITSWPQHGEAFNHLKGTLRGLHLQREPYAEAKVIRCTRGAMYDVFVDARPESPTHGRWEAFELDEHSAVALYAAPGFAHGYQTRSDETTVEYLLSVPYVPEAATGFRYDSAPLGIDWPLVPVAVSARDRALPVFAQRSDIDA